MSSPCGYWFSEYTLGSSSLEELELTRRKNKWPSSDLCTTAKSLPLYSSSQQSCMLSRRGYPPFTSKGIGAQELASSCLGWLLLTTNLWPLEPEHQEAVCREIHMCGFANLLDDSVGNGISYSSPVTMCEYLKVCMHTMCTSNALRGQKRRWIPQNGSCGKLWAFLFCVDSGKMDSSSLQE